MSQINSTLVPRLEAGWKANLPGPALEILQLLGVKLHVEMEITAQEDDCIEFRFGLPKIRLLGANDIRATLVGGKGSGGTAAVANFVAGIRQPGRIHLIFAGTSALATLATSRMAPLSGVVVPPTFLSKFLEHTAPEDLLKIEFRRQLGMERLMPFDIEHPVPTNMFFGRQQELDVLGGTSSVAIAGPSRIGKTSLLLEHRRRLVRRIDSRMHCSTYVDFSAVKQCKDEEAVRHLAMKMNPTRKNYEMRPIELLHFLRSEFHRLGTPAELLLDEVDEVIRLDFIDTLAMAAREGLCRLVLAGKANLFETIYKRESALAARVELIRPCPLTTHEMVELLLQPFADLGYQVSSADLLADTILGLTGGLPQNIQYLGRRLYRISQTSGSRIIDPAFLDRVRGDFEYGHYVRSTYKSLAQHKNVAERLLCQGSRAFDAVVVQQIFRDVTGLPLGVLDAADLADNWVIANFLVWWGRGSYRIACPAMLELVQSGL